MLIRAPWGEIASPALGDEYMDMRVPFQVPAKRMKDTDKAGSEIFRMIEIVKHTQDDISDGMKKAVQKGVVLEKENTKFFRDCKNTVPMDTGNQLAGHTKSPFLIVHVTTGRTESAFTGKGN